MSRAGRQSIGHGHQSTLEAAVPGPLARERAAVALVLVAGLQVTFQILEIDVLAAIAPKDLEQILTSVIRPLFENAKASA